MCQGGATSSKLRSGPCLFGVPCLGWQHESHHFRGPRFLTPHLGFCHTVYFAPGEASGITMRKGIPIPGNAKGMAHNMVWNGEKTI